jgi:nucleotide-binding universal stress UspA family protein
MTFKDLLVYIDQRPAAAARLEAALTLATAFDAHLTALHLIAEPFVPSGTGSMSGLHLPEELIRQHIAQAEAEAESILTQARDAAAARGVTIAVRRESGPLDRLPNLLARYARHADLTLVGQPDLETGGVDDAILAEAAFVDSGRPALVVPRDQPVHLPPRRAVIAWDGSREAARAMGEAIPLLRAAETTTVLIVDGHDASSHPGERPGTEVATHLGRHGIRAEVREVASGSAGVADTVLHEASNDGADLLVMGGYGHSRLREMFIGGVTRHVLDHLTMPVLLAH